MMAGFRRWKQMRRLEKISDILGHIKFNLLDPSCWQEATDQRIRGLNLLLEEIRQRPLCMAIISEMESDTGEIEYLLRELSYDSGNQWYGSIYLPVFCLTNGVTLYYLIKCSRQDNFNCAMCLERIRLYIKQGEQTWINGDCPAFANDIGIGR